MFKRLVLYALLFSGAVQAQVTNYSNRLPGDPGIFRNQDLNGQQLAPYLDAFTFTVSGSGTATTTYKIPVNILYVGIKSQIEGQSSGEYVKIEVVDVDNILGFGANTVINTPVLKQFVSLDNMTAFELGYPRYGLANLYIKVSYTTSNALANVRVRVNMIGHRVL